MLCLSNALTLLLLPAVLWAVRPTVARIAADFDTPAPTAIRGLVELPVPLSFALAATVTLALVLKQIFMKSAGWKLAIEVAVTALLTLAVVAISAGFVLLLARMIRAVA